MWMMTVSLLSQQYISNSIGTVLLERSFLNPSRKRNSVLYLNTMFFKFFSSLHGFLKYFLDTGYAYIHTARLASPPARLQGTNVVKITGPEKCCYAQKGCVQMFQCKRRGANTAIPRQQASGTSSLTCQNSHKICTIQNSLTNFGTKTKMGMFRPVTGCQNRQIVVESSHVTAQLQFFGR